MDITIHTSREWNNVISAVAAEFAKRSVSSNTHNGAITAILRAIFLFLQMDRIGPLMVRRQLVCCSETQVVQSYLLHVADHV